MTTVKNLEGCSNQITTHHRNILSKDIAETLDGYIAEVDHMTNWSNDPDVQRSIGWIEMAFENASNTIFSQIEQYKIISDSRNNTRSDIADGVRNLTIRYKQANALINTELVYKINF